MSNGDNEQDPKRDDTEQDPKLPHTKDDQENAGKDAAKLEDETFALKLSAKADYKKAIAQEEAKMKAGLSVDHARLADLKMKVVDVNEKLIKEILDALRRIL